MTIVARYIAKRVRDSCVIVDNVTSVYGFANYFTEFNVHILETHIYKLVSEFGVQTANNFWKPIYILKN